MTVLRRFAAGWRAFWHRVGVIQTTIILTALYYTIMAGMALLARLLRKEFLNPAPLPATDRRNGGEGHPPSPNIGRGAEEKGSQGREGPITYWLEREPAELKLESLQRQF